MAKWSYLGGSTIVGGGGHGFSPLLEGGEKKSGRSVLTENQKALKKRSKDTAKRLGVDQRTKKQKKKDAKRI